MAVLLAQSVLALLREVYWKGGGLRKGPGGQNRASSRRRPHTPLAGFSSGPHQRLTSSGYSLAESETSRRAGMEVRPTSPGVCLMLDAVILSDIHLGSD